MDYKQEVSKYLFDSAFSNELLQGFKAATFKLPAGIISGISAKIGTDCSNRLNKELFDDDVLFFNAFRYMFSLGLEITYFSRNQNYSEIEYRFDDIVSEKISGNVPSGLVQLQLAKKPILERVFFAVLGELKKIFPPPLDTEVEKRLVLAILGGGAELGYEFCLRVELPGDSVEAD